jgi:phage shock protein E
MEQPKSPSIIDVRSPEEFREQHYPGAINIPLQDLMAQLDEIREMQGPIVVYCRSGNRSLMAKHILGQNGIQNVIDGGGLNEMMKNKSFQV